MIELLKYILPKDKKLLAWMVVLGGFATWDIKSTQIKLIDNDKFLQFQITELREGKKLSAILPKEIEMKRY